MTRLLLISCSSTKREGAAAMAALDRYDGPKFRVLRKALAEGVEPPTIRILSAAYGLIGPEMRIVEYDVTLTSDRAMSMAASRLCRSDFDDCILDADDVFVMAGGSYERVLEAWRTTLITADRLPQWRYATGAPGQRLQQLGQWLRNTNHGGA